MSGEIPAEVAAVIGEPSKEPCWHETVQECVAHPGACSALAPPQAPPPATERDRRTLSLQTRVAHLVELAAGLESDASAEGFDAHHQLGRIVRMITAGEEVAALANKLRVQFAALCIDAERAARTPSDATEGATT